MEDSTMRDPVRFPSSDGRTELHGFVWHSSEGERVKGIVQIAHGMAEHIARYDRFARFLVNSGYTVCGYDQIGHGASSDPSRYGKLPAQHGKEFLVRDQHKMRELMREHHAGLPYFVFGHSLGSYIMRSYIASHGEGLAGCILSGTGHIAPAISRAGHFLANRVCKKQGEDTLSTSLDSMGAGGYNRGIPNPRTDYDWLSYDESNVDRYIADPACGFMFSAGGYAVVTSLTAEVCSKKCFERIPKSLPVLFISGSEDPVGDCGKGVRKAFSMAQNAGLVDVSCKLYDHMRHEILNETERDLVYNDVLNWLDEHVEY